MDPLHGILARIRRRLILIQWVSFQVTGLLYAAIAACVWLLMVRVFPMLGEPIVAAGIFLAAAVLGAALWTWRTRPTLVGAALAADERLGLEERLTSSLQLEGVDQPMVAAVHADARGCLKHINVSRDFPLVSPPSLRWLALPVFVFGLGYVLLPELDLFNYRERQAAALAEEQSRLEKANIIKEAIAPLERIENNLPLDSMVAEVMGEMDEIADGLAKGELTERQAMARVLSKSEELATEAQKLAESGGMPKLTDDPAKFGEAAEMAEALSEGDFEKAAEAAEEIMEKLAGDELSQEQKQQLAQQLQQLSQKLEGGNPALQNALASLAAAAQSGDSQNMGEGMKQLEMSIDDLKSVAEQMKQMQMAGQCMGGACEGMGLKPGMGKPGLAGNWQPGQGMQGSGGMRKKGRGKGGQIGDLPDVNTGLTPDMLPGDMENGPVLATITQLTPPDEDNPESTITYLEGSIVQVQADAERALEQEEIPAGAKEFVRQYFGTMEQGQETNTETIQ